MGAMSGGRSGSGYARQRKGIVISSHTWLRMISRTSLGRAIRGLGVDAIFRYRMRRAAEVLIFGPSIISVRVISSCLIAEKMAALVGA